MKIKLGARVSLGINGKYKNMKTKILINRKY